MKESYSKGLAICAVPEWYAGDGDVAGLATTGAHAGQVLSSEITHPVCRHTVAIGRQYRMLRYGEKQSDTAESATLCMCGNSRRENREVRFGFRPSVATRLQRVLERNGQSTSQTVLLT